MRILKSLLIAFIGVTALLYVLQNLANLGEMREQVRHVMSVTNASDVRPVISWAAFAMITLCQLAIAIIALEGRLGPVRGAARHARAI